MKQIALAAAIIKRIIFH